MSFYSGFNFVGNGAISMSSEIEKEIVQEIKNRHQGLGIY